MTDKILSDEYILSCREGRNYGGVDLIQYARALEAEILRQIAATQADVPEGWRIECGRTLVDEGYACVRNLESQCGQDFYEKRDPLMFAFLLAFAAPQPTQGEVSE